MKHISVMIKPASALCNLRCNYCFYADVSSLREVRSYGRMKQGVARKMIDNIFVDLEDGDHLTLAFQGGEPTLAGLKYYEDIVSLVNTQAKNIDVHYAIQTNGILIDEKWCRFLAENQFLVGLSLDVVAAEHNFNRVDTRGQGTFTRVLATKKMFDHYRVDYNILCVLTNNLAQKAAEVFDFILSNHIEYIQFIPCLDDLDAKKSSREALTPSHFAKFYQELLTMWSEELQRGHYVKVKLFDDLLQLFGNQQITACGILGDCQVQYVIEADGSVYPCDFFVLDQYRLGNIQEKSLRSLFETEISHEFRCEKAPLAKECQQCPFLKVCFGGCKRMKQAIYLDETSYCGYQNLLQVFLPKISQLMENLQKLEKEPAS
ncbi:SPASM domain-containing protein [Enterococcus sp. LJL120]